MEKYLKIIIIISYNVFYIIAFFIPFTIFSQMEYKTHFNIINQQLKILKLSDEEFIFYGDKGGVLRTYDGCKKWKQQYSGTHNYIIKLNKHNDKVIGITMANELMISEDKGNLWKVKKIPNLEVKDFTMLNQIIFVASKNNQINYSNDFGDKWEKIICPSDSILFIENFNDLVFIQDKNFNVFYYNSKENIWKELTNIGQNYMVKKNERLFFFNSKIIKELKNDLSIIDYNFDISINSFFPRDKEIILVNSNVNSMIFQCHKFNTETNNTKEIYNDTIIGLLNRQNYDLIDLNYIYNEVIFSFLGKTILKYNDSLNTWGILSTIPFTNGSYEFYDKDNLYLFSTANILKSTDACTFKLGKGYNGIYNLSSKFFMSENEIYVNNNGVSEVSSFLKTMDGGNSYTTIGNIRTPTILLDTINGNFFIKNSYQYEPPKNGYFDKFIKVSYDLKKFDTLFNIDSIISPFNFVRVVNKFFLFYSVGHPFNKMRKTFIVETDENFKNFDTLFNYSGEYIFDFVNVRKYDHSIYFANVQTDYGEVSSKNRKIYKFTNNFRNYEIIEDTTLIYVGNQDEINLKSVEFKNKILRLTNSTTDSNGKKLTSHQFVKLNFDDETNKFDIEVVGESLGSFLFQTIGGDQIIYYGGNQNIWIPIDEEHLVMNVENAEQGPPAIWTFSPVPNPVKDKCKVKIWTPYMHKISELKIELINIGSGITHHIHNYELNQIDGYHADIEIDFENQATGAYILNFRLDGKSMSETIIIE